MSYSERPHREVKVFDLKDFVHKLKGDDGSNPFPAGGFDSPMGMGMPNPFMPQGIVPGRGASVMPTSLDDYVKKLDEKIAELEKEEELERQAEEAKKKEAKVEKVDSDNEEIKVMPSQELVSKSQKEIEDEIAEIFEPSAEKKEENSEEDYFKTIPITTIEDIDDELEPEKTNVNVDTDSVVVNNKTSDEDFYDDFFGDEDE